MTPITEPAAPPPWKLDVSHLVTEDDTPVDNLFSEKQMRLLTEPLYASWQTKRPFVAMANVGLFYSVSKPAIVPDVLLSMDVEPPTDVWAKEHRSYLNWEYDKSPDIVIEVVSNRIGDERDEKMDIYATAGVPYYVIFDPVREIMTERLTTYEKVGLKYKVYGEAIFLEVGLRLVEWTGEYEGLEEIWLRWAHLDGSLIPTGAERANAETKRANAETKRANAETKRANEESKRANEEAEKALFESTRADQATQSAEKARVQLLQMAEKLRAAGIDPDGI
jgi:Uma2 family endonuclease